MNNTCFNNTCYTVVDNDELRHPGMRRVILLVNEQHTLRWTIYPREYTWMNKPRTQALTRKDRTGFCSSWPGGKWADSNMMSAQELYDDMVRFGLPAAEIEDLLWQLGWEIEGGTK